MAITLQRRTGLCVREARASLLASLPIRQYRVRANGDRTEITAPVLGLLSKVEPILDVSAAAGNDRNKLLCLWGSAYWFRTRANRHDGAGRNFIGAGLTVRWCCPSNKNTSAVLCSMGRTESEIPFLPSEVIGCDFQTQ